MEKSGIKFEGLLASYLGLLVTQVWITWNSCHDEAAVSFWQGKTEMQQLIMWQVDRQSSHECLLVGELRILGVKKQSAAMFQWCWKSSPLIVEVCCFDATMELLLLDSHGQYNN